MENEEALSSWSDYFGSAYSSGNANLPMGLYATILASMRCFIWGFTQNNGKIPLVKSRNVC